MFKGNNKNNDVVLVFLLLILNMLTLFSSVPIVDFKEVNVGWVMLICYENKPFSLKFWTNNSAAWIIETQNKLS